MLKVRCIEIELVGSQLPQKSCDEVQGRDVLQSRRNRPEAPKQARFAAPRSLLPHTCSLVGLFSSLLAISSSDLHIFSSTTSTMVAAPSLFETPSKVAASALSSLDLTKPESINDKLGVVSNTNALRKEHKSATEVDETSTNGRDRFVGNLDIKSDADEPLLKPTDNRFVLFPIKYHEVSSFGFGRNAFQAKRTRRRVDCRGSSLILLASHYRSGLSTRRPKLPSGPPRRWT